MKLKDVIPAVEYNNKLKRQTRKWFEFPQYRSANSINGGVIRWSYGADKRANNDY